MPSGRETRALAVSLESSLLETLSRARNRERATAASGEAGWRRISEEEEEERDEEEAAALAAAAKRPRRNDRGITLRSCPRSQPLRSFLFLDSSPS